MFEARLGQASLFKKILEAVKELCNIANFEVTNTGISLQSMDSAHVSLVSLLLRSEGFEHFRCDRSRQLGVSLKALSTIMKCGGNDDKLTIKAEDSGDVITFIFESPTEDKVSTFELKLMDIDAEHLGIPDSVFTCVVRISSLEFQRVIRDLSMLGDSVDISVSKGSVKFSTSGDIGSATITLAQHAEADKPEEATVIELEEEISLSFATRYLVNFTKATPMSSQVVLGFKDDSPVLVTYNVGDIGHVKYYLAPKLDSDEDDEESGAEMADD